MDCPKISIIIPVYNAEPFLSECIHSLLTQTIDDLEIICVDDESEDRSLQFLRKMAVCDKRLVVLSQSHSGQGMARNRGVQVARGEFIGFVDADDYVAPTFYERLLASSEWYGADISSCRAWNVNSDSTECQPLRMWDTLLPGTYNQTDIMGLDFFNSGCSPVLWNKLIRRDLAISYPSSDQRRGQDFLTLIDFVAHASVISFIDDRLYYYRHHNCSAMAAPEQYETIADDLNTEAIALSKIENYYPGTLLLDYYLSNSIKQWTIRLGKYSYLKQEKYQLSTLINNLFCRTKTECIFRSHMLNLLRT